MENEKEPYGLRNSQIPPELRGKLDLILVFVFLTVATLAAGAVHFLRQRTAVYKAAAESLEHLAEARATALQAWYRERASDALGLTTNPITAQALASYLRNPADASLKKGWQTALDTLAVRQDYCGAYLTAADGRPVLAARNSEPIPEKIAPFVAQSLRSARLEFTDFFNNAENHVRLAFIAPLKADGQTPPGAFVLLVDPARSIDPLLELRPGSKTTETLLVRREGASVLLLSPQLRAGIPPLTNRWPAALTLPNYRLREDGTRVPLRTTNQQGVEVLAAWRPVPGTSWLVTTQRAEAALNAPLAEAGLRTGVWVVLSVALAGFAVLFLWNRRQVQHQKERLALIQRNQALELRHSILMRHAKDMILICTPEGTILEANDATLAAYGYTSEELIGKHISELYAPECRSRFHEVQAAIRSRDGVTLELEQIARDGRRFTIEASIRLVDIGGIVYRFSIGRDITARKRAENEVLRLTRALRLLSDCNQVLIRGRDEGSLVQALCRTFVESGGYLGACAYRVGGDPEHPQLEQFAEAGKAGCPLPPPSWPNSVHFEAPLGKAIASRQVVVTRLAGDCVGTKWPASDAEPNVLTAAILPWQVNGRVEGLLLVLSPEPSAFDAHELSILNELSLDISFGMQAIRTEQARREAMEALQDREAFLKKAQEIAELGPWRASGTLEDWEKPNRPIIWGEWVYKIFGVSPETFQPTRRSFLEAVHPQDREKVAMAVRNALVSGKPYTVEHRIVRPDGSVRFVRQRADVIRRGPGEPIEMVGVIQDFTEYKQLEDQLLQAQRLESIGRLAGGIAHDFNNLLTVINGYSDLLLSSRTPPMHALREIRRAGEKASHLTRQLLAFGRKQLLQPSSINLNDVIRESEDLLRRLIGEDIDLKLCLSEDLGPIHADPVQMHQVLMNLAINAREAMLQGGKLLIETANVRLDPSYCDRHTELSPGSYVQLSISDSGVGMPPEIQAKIFEPFFTTKPGNTGLGLSTVYGIVRQSGGFIWVYSEPGKGTTFKIHFPRHDQPADSVASAPSTPSPGLYGDETILVMEDNPDVLGFLCAALEQYGYHVLPAANAEQAMEMATSAREKIDLLLTDVVIPNVSARQLATRFLESRPQARVLYISGYTENAVAHRGILDPNVQFLQKPFSPEDLALKVRAILDSPPTGGSA